MTLISRLLSSFFLALLIWLTTSPYAFALYELNKVRVYLTQQRSIDTLEVNNPGDEPSNLQAQIYAWTIVNGKDDLQPSNEIIVSPPIMKIPPKRKQLLRVGWRKPTALASEKMFRLFVTEITPEKPMTQTGVRIRLRLGIPIFVLPANPVYSLNWASQGLIGKKFKVRVTNAGNVHINLGIVDLKTEDNRTVGTYPGSVYIFPGQSTVIEFAMTDTATKNLTIQAGTDYQTMRANITLP